MEEVNLSSREVMVKNSFGNITVLTEKYVHLSIGPHCNACSTLQISNFAWASPCCSCSSSGS